MGPSQSREQRRLQRKHRHQRNQRIQEREVAEAEEQEREERTQQEEEEAPPPPSPSPQPQMSSYHSESSSTPYGYSPTAPVPRRTSSSRRTSRLSDHYRQSSHTPRGGGGGGRDSRAGGGRDSRAAAACYEGIDTPTLTTALAYTSNRLLAKTKSHHTFVVTGDVLFSLFFRSKPMTGSVSIIQTSALTDKQKDTLISAVLRAAEKYGIAREDWMNNSAEVDMRTVVGMGKGEVDEVIAWSLGQKEIVFSGDGMTLLAVDFVYEFRRMLHFLTRALEGGGEDEEGETVDLDDVVELVRRLVTVEGRGRSLRRGVVEGRYQRLVFSDYAWMMVGREYERRFGEKGLKEDDEESDDEDEGDRVGDSTSVWTDCS
ncbi:hypothetical protein H072_813 [Dactylellina haptotyla CBS 200.50]|uniref:DUF7582 domain-containing protein n=1 Tax=Dactylellina haptotyla (strain CBS 200.50) TaxID=1284197 RepID=S8C097_DACHA|nr:hypothetical protein H072_813 [Dactylellina haptotyla CBS 200.50]